jgi:hypothetical protein
MPKQEIEARVLSRVGARVITEQELKLVSGAFKTGVCTFNPTTCAIDNDCSPPPGC